MAAGAMDLLNPVMAQQDALFRSADVVYRTQSATLGAMRTGATPMRSNPPIAKMARQSLTAIEKQLPEMSATDQQALRQSKLYDIASRFRAGSLTPERAAKLLAEPTSDLSREFRIAGLDPDKYAKALRTPDRPVFQRPVVTRPTLPPKPTPRSHGPEVTAALRGLDVTRTPAIPSPANPERSLASLARDATRMAPDERMALQEGAAAGFRRELGSGKSLNLGVPERAAQFGYATRAPGGVETMRSVDDAWNAVEKLQGRVLPSGVAGVEPPSGGLLAAGADVLSPWWKRTVVNVVRRTIGESSATNSALRSATDAQIMKWITSDPGTIAKELADMSVKDRKAVEKAMQAVSLAARANAIRGSARQNESVTGRNGLLDY
jgi:hypothetical protein